MANSAITITKLPAINGMVGNATADKVSLNHADLGSLNMQFTNRIGTQLPTGEGIDVSINKAVGMNGSLSYRFLDTLLSGTVKNGVFDVTTAKKELNWIEDVQQLAKAKFFNPAMTNFDIQKGLGPISNTIDDFMSQIENSYFENTTTELLKAAGTIIDIPITATDTDAQKGEKIYSTMNKQIATLSAGVTVGSVKRYFIKQDIVVMMSVEAFGWLIQSGKIGNNAKDAFESGIYYVGLVGGIRIFINPTFTTCDLFVTVKKTYFAKLQITAVNAKQIGASNDVELYIEWEENRFKTPLLTTDTAKAYKTKVS